MSPRASFRVVALFGGMFLILFGISASHLKSGGSFAWELAVVEGLHHRVPLAQTLVWPSILAGPIAALVAVVVLLRKRRLASAALFCAALGGVIVLDPVIKEIVARPPLNPTSGGYSFPSGSAMILLATVGAFVLTTPAVRRPIPLAGLAALIAYQGAMLVSIRWHYPSDVIGGWLVTVAWLAAVAWGAAAFATPADRERLPADGTRR